MRTRTIERALRDEPRWQTSTPRFRRAFIKRLRNYDDSQPATHVRSAFRWFIAGALWCHSEHFAP